MSAQSSPSRASALLTDLYQLTMLQAYVEHHMEQTAVFEFFVRQLPPQRAFLVSAGIEQVLDEVETMRFHATELDFLRHTGRFSQDLLGYLATMRFTGDIHAMPEGTICFANEPILRVTAALPQAQLLESRLINLVHLQTLVASKAVRAVLVAPGKLLVDFGMRRAHGAEAAVLAARASYLAGFAGTSNVLAGMRFDIPIYGTVAHSFIEAHEDEAEAFVRFARSQRDNAVFVLDTYDTERAARTVVRLAPGLKQEGIRITAVRLDSGDLAAQAGVVRRILDAAGLSEVRIVASGGLDEFSVRALLDAKAPLDGFGIGTRLAVSADAPSLDCAYKLQEYAGRPCYKRSEGKATWPGRKQVYRRCDGSGTMGQDVVALEGDPQDGEPLLVPVMRSGRRLAPSPSLADIRRRVSRGLAQLPDALRSLEPSRPYPVRFAASLEALRRT